jgi:ferrous iron transport protein A
MKILDLKMEQQAKVVKIDCSKELKQRFYSFGIIKGVILYIENISLTKNTIEINIEDTSIALRVEEAKSIEVEVI